MAELFAMYKWHVPYHKYFRIVVNKIGIARHFWKEEVDAPHEMGKFLWAKTKKTVFIDMFIMI